MTLWSNQSNLNRGEIDETLEGRIDTDLYYNALSKARNVLLTPQGGAKKRPGTKYVDDHSIPGPGYIHLESFSFNNEIEYLLYFVPATTVWRIYVYKDDVLQTNINGSGFDYFTAPVIDADWENFYYIQSANTAIVFGANNPIVITRTSDTAWSADLITFTNIPQYDFNDTASPTPVDEVHSLTFTNANTSDTYKLVIDSFISEDIAYSASTSENADRIARAIQDLPNTASSGVSVAFSAGTTYTVTFSGESAGNYGIITGIGVVTQSTSFSAESTITTPGTSRKEDVFSALRGWPKTGVFHQSRLWVASTDSLPDSLWGSVVGDFFNLDQGKARDDEAIFVTLQTSQVNDIQAMASARKLQVYTSGAEFYCPQDVITPTNVTFEAQTNYGSNYLKPATIDGQVIFPQRESRALILLDIVNQYQPPSSRNIGVLAPHLLKSISKIVTARGSSDSDANYVYLLNGDGKIACLNYLPAENVEGFSLWDAGDTIRDITVVGKKLYMVVERGSKLYIEVEDDALTVDCGVTVSASQTVDLTHLIGLTTVEAVGDGAYLGEFTASASTDLGRVVTSGYAGLAFRPQVRTMSIVASLANGTNYGRKKRIRRALLSIYQSNSITVNGTIVADRTIGVNQFDAPIPQTDLIRVRLRGYALEQFLDISQTAPLGFFIRSLGVEMKV